MRRELRERGFTLFEVMAAVLVLGMLYAVLANAAMQGLQSEGETRRRLQASLIADRALAEIETQLALGVILPLASRRRSRIPFWCA
jgi:prepilin-type N-terminal cleavage/methylation domain-containing protein